VAVLVSRHDHALLDLLWNWRRGDLRADIPLVISNHEDLRQSVESFGVPYLHVPNSAATRPQAEARMLEALEGKADVVVLARYMQVLSGDFVARHAGRIINIHHSFLPAFAGADPYRQAYERGVKIVGATAHYVTAELDAGPIIDQDVARVSHKDSVEDLRALGRDLERRVLFRAVRWHCEDRVLVHGNKTIVFA
jgi:formyltetrahydrofolate deformylase